VARPRTVSDADILSATARVVAREGPLRFTLADVAREVGLTAPALLKRFESKRALLLAMSRASRAEVAAHFAREPGEPALEALHRGLAAHAEGLATPRALANGLAFLAIDVTDAEFREVAVGFFDSFRASTERLLLDAVAEGELAREADAAALAGRLEVAFNGSLITWGIRQEGSAQEALAAEVEALLAPFRTRRTGRAAPIRPAPRRGRGGGQASRGT